MASSAPATARLSEWIASSAIFLVSFAFVARTLWLMDRGFDFTDEAFYLALSQQPVAFDITYGLFGYGLHPLFELVGGSIAGLRRAAAVVLLILGAGGGLIAIESMKRDWRSPFGLAFITVSAVLPFGYYVLWSPTPSYNWFALAGGLVVIVTALDLRNPDRAMRSAALAAVGMTLAVFARPQNAIGYGCIYAIAIFVALPTFKGKLRQAALTAGFVVALAGLIALAAPLRTIAVQAQAYIAIFGTSNPTESSLFARQLELFQHAGVWIPFAAMLFVGSLATSSQRETPANKWRVGLILIGALVAAIGMLIVFRSRGFMHTVGPAAAVAAYLALAIAGLQREANFRLLALSGIAALVPLAATFGTSNQINLQLPYFIGLWGFVALVSLSGGRLFPGAGYLAALTCLLATVASVQFGLRFPYRLAAPVSAQVIPTTLGWGATLKLDAGTSDFVTSLHDRARQEGFCQGDAALDLSGSMPGAVFVIGGRMPVFPWLFAGYPFSDHFAREIFKRIDRPLLAQSWLITSDTPNSFTMAELQSFGIDFNAYRLVAEFRYPLDNAPVKLFAPRTIEHRC